MKQFASNRFALTVSVGLLLGAAAGFGWSWNENLQPHFYDPIPDWEWNILTAVLFAVVGAIIGLVLAVFFTKYSSHQRTLGNSKSKEEAMKKDECSTAPEVDADPKMLDEYDFSGGRRGVYAEQYAQGTNLVALLPDVAAVFPNSESVNEALRALLKAARRSVKPQPHKERGAA